jgi:primary-amine oxidase
MVLERLKQVAQHVAGTAPATHPFDPLSQAEIEDAVSIVSKEHGKLWYNTVTLWEPRKAEMLAWLQKPTEASRPHRVADVVAIDHGKKAYDGVVNLTTGKIVSWTLLDGVQPIVS